ncbi:hypothetical protein DFH06DRAFT_1194467 [Mycena polygramma]|nr:hypothetical protein DFH06DRAFT_1194467 [Mycena polygramma]
MFPRRRLGFFSLRSCVLPPSHSIPSLVSTLLPLTFLFCLRVSYPHSYSSFSSLSYSYPYAHTHAHSATPKTSTSKRPRHASARSRSGRRARGRWGWSDPPSLSLPFSRAFLASLVPQHTWSWSVEARELPYETLCARTDGRLTSLNPWGASCVCPARLESVAVHSASIPSILFLFSSSALLPAHPPDLGRRLQVLPREQRRGLHPVRHGDEHGHEESRRRFRWARGHL